MSWFRRHRLVSFRRLEANARAARDRAETNWSYRRKWYPDHRTTWTAWLAYGVAYIRWWFVSRIRGA